MFVKRKQKYVQADESILCRFGIWNGTATHVYAANFYLPSSLSELFYDTRRTPYLTQVDKTSSGRFLCKFERHQPHIDVEDDVYFTFGTITNGLLNSCVLAFHLLSDGWIASIARIELNNAASLPLYRGLARNKARPFDLCAHQDIRISTTSSTSTPRTCTAVIIFSLAFFSTFLEQR